MSCCNCGCGVMLLNPRTRRPSPSLASRIELLCHGVISDVLCMFVLNNGKFDHIVVIFLGMELWIIVVKEDTPTNGCEKGNSVPSTFKELPKLSPLFRDDRIHLFFHKTVRSPGRTFPSSLMLPSLQMFLFCD